MGLSGEPSVATSHSGHGDIQPATPSSQVKLSVVIRCRNEATSLRRVFEALGAQRCGFSWEVIVVDNQSEDDTKAVCAEFGARVVPIGRDEFTYGRALNVGIGQARGEVVLLMSAHALPVGTHFLEDAVAPFSDRTIAAARLLLIGNREQMSRWYQPRDIHYPCPAKQAEAEAGTRWVSEYPTATCCAIRRSVWEQIKYDESIEANEDKLWARQVLASGYKIRCCAAAVYMYTRQYGKLDSWRRLNRQHVALYRITGHAPMKWRTFGLLVARSLAFAPLAAARYVLDNVVSSACLVTVPLQAKRRPKPGSFPEFETR